jgi:ferritin-like metal-binding protein YciE
MAINSLQDKFIHELRDIYDAEHQFLEGQQLMLQNAKDQKLQSMITTHISQTQQHIRNLEQAFQLLGQKAQRQTCDGAKGIVTEGKKLMEETKGMDALQDTAIAGAADKVEHYEIASYRGLIQGAQLMNQPQLVQLLQANLQQEEQTSQLIESSAPQLLQKAMQQNYQDGDSMRPVTYP